VASIASGVCLFIYLGIHLETDVTALDRALKKENYSFFKKEKKPASFSRGKERELGREPMKQLFYFMSPGP
jgi:hypothetical protein